ncbi:MAG: DUF2933 domain-containing protein [Nitrospira sp. CG24B]|jgi:hypothetical protein|nr:MAG: DUF2933 domain-containing protein [Nitrospira sp. CG24B]
MNNLRRLVLGAFLAVLGFFLVTEHRAHLFGVLPYLFLFACPLFHLLLHRRHGGHGIDSPQGRKEPDSQANAGGHSHG